MIPKLAVLARRRSSAVTSKIGFLKTLAAVAGDSKWRRLGDLLNKEVEADCSTWNKELGKCPHCEQMLEGNSVPEICPHCQKSIHGANRGLWYAFLYAIRNSFNYKGRATRTEFWGFYLFSYIISLAVGQITNIFVLTVKQSLCI